LLVDGTEATLESKPNDDKTAGITRLPNSDHALSWHHGCTAMLAEVRNIGWIRRYRAGSGDLDPSIGETKIVDYLRDSGFQFVFAGGDRDPKQNELQHVVERVIRGCRFMSVNVLALSPGHVVGYEGTSFTIAALEQAGLRVTTFPSHELVRANGGPHCLTMPLERE
jgi:hypothetical protein